jgi:RimJ/RimL family protein N-acetyltransferase
VTQEAGFALREAREEDAAALLAWRNDPITRVFSFNPEPVTWPEHVAWLRRRLADPDCLFLIAVDAGGAPVGTVRFDRSAHGVEVSITVSPETRGHGLGTRLLRAGCREAFWRTGAPVVEALVLPVNEMSVHAFLRAGFVETGTVEVAGWKARRFVLGRDG